MEPQNPNPVDPNLDPTTAPVGPTAPAEGDKPAQDPAAPAAPAEGEAQA